MGNKRRALLGGTAEGGCPYIFSLFYIFSKEGVMQMAITFTAVVGGLIFSLAVALLAEELIFGQVFRLFFAPQKLAAESMARKSAAHR
jgi:ABC-type enterobactin transport system permease subunit